MKSSGNRPDDAEQMLGYVQVVQIWSTSSLTSPNATEVEYEANQICETSIEGEGEAPYELVSSRGNELQKAGYDIGGELQFELNRACTKTRSLSPERCLRSVSTGFHPNDLATQRSNREERIRREAKQLKRKVELLSVQNQSKNSDIEGIDEAILNENAQVIGRLESTDDSANELQQYRFPAKNRAEKSELLFNEERMAAQNLLTDLKNKDIKKKHLKKKHLKKKHLKKKHLKKKHLKKKHLKKKHLKKKHLKKKHLKKKHLKKKHLKKKHLAEERKLQPQAEKLLSDIAKRERRYRSSIEEKTCSETDEKLKRARRVRKSLNTHGAVSSSSETDQNVKGKRQAKAANTRPAISSRSKIDVKVKRDRGRPRGSKSQRVSQPSTSRISKPATRNNPTTFPSFEEDDFKVRGSWPFGAASRTRSAIKSSGGNISSRTSVPKPKYHNPISRMQRGRSMFKTVKYHGSDESSSNEAHEENWTSEDQEEGDRKGVRTLRGAEYI